MRPALKRRNSPANEAGNDILWCQAGITKVVLNPVEGVDFPHRVLRIVGPILHLIWRNVNVCRQVEQVNICSVLHIKEALLPFLA
jgi:hypothetical protein